MALANEQRQEQTLQSSAENAIVGLEKLIDAHFILIKQ
jgi:hypothetical protein